MPLLKGKKAKTKKGFSKNVSTEVKAGKPVKQAVAIAYDLKRGGKKDNKKSVKKESFDKLINQYLNHYLFEDITPTAPPDPKKVQQATDAAKKAILAKAGKINPSMVAKAIKATNDAGLDPTKLTS